jgi:hypothetical protein
MLLGHCLLTLALLTLPPTSAAEAATAHVTLSFV